MQAEARDVSIRELSGGMRRLLWVAGFLVLLAGSTLFIFTEQTESWFAWTIDLPLTAAFLGAGYWASVAFEWLAARERAWIYARISVPSVFVFTFLTLIATLIHLELFHLGSSFPSGTQAIAWAWIAIYASVPVAMAWLWVTQSRAQGKDPAKTAPLPGAIRTMLVIHGAMMLPLGAYLFLAPERALSLWPWALTPLTGRAVGAWVFSVGITAAQAARENDLERIRVASFGYIGLGVLQLLALARYLEVPDWSDVRALVYVVVLLSMVATGAAILARRSRLR
ncbi:MAG: hypothetical protein M3454_06230 [Actinomycetota bacterium]|nr:hypothetical protein [Actinomycetota bacterium]